MLSLSGHSLVEFCHRNLPADGLKQTALNVLAAVQGDGKPGEIFS
jgi:hypothetical protein